MGIGSISIDYDNCMLQAKRLDELASECETRAREAERLADQMFDEWRGSSGKVMSVKIRYWAKSHNHQASKMHDAAAQIRNTANAIKRADEEAAARIAAEQAAASAAASRGSDVRTNTSNNNAGAAQSAINSAQAARGSAVTNYDPVSVIKDIGQNIGKAAKNVFNNIFKRK